MVEFASSLETLETLKTTFGSGHLACTTLQAITDDHTTNDLADKTLADETLDEKIILPRTLYYGLHRLSSLLSRHRGDF